MANGALLTGIMSSRLAYGMAREGLLPAFLTRVLPVRRTPWAAIAATTIVSALLAATGEIDVLAGTLVLLLLVVFLTVNTAVLVLRRDRTTAPHFRAPAVVPVLGALSCVALATQIEGRVWARGLVLMGVGAVLGALMLWRRRAAKAQGEPLSDSPRPADDVTDDVTTSGTR